MASGSGACRGQFMPRPPIPTTPRHSVRDSSWDISLVEFPLWVKRAMREGVDALLQDPRPLFAVLRGGAPVPGPLRKLQLVWDDIRMSDDPSLYLTGGVPKMQDRDWIKVGDDVSADFPRILDCNQGCKTKMQEVHLYAEGWRSGLMQENPLGLQQYVACVEGEVRKGYSAICLKCCVLCW
jgi:hypothetical protein